ncbi:MAG: hypothetical protein DLM59_04220, partial [Pseudonocardiales bacterium]
VGVEHEDVLLDSGLPVTMLRPSKIHGEEGLSPKERDPHRDGHYAMHSYAGEDDEDAFFLAGLGVPLS